MASTAFLLVAIGITAADAPVSNNEPVLRLDAGGATTVISSLAWGAQAETLFHAGYDKVVHVWKRDPQSGRFVVESNATYRIPVGPGQTGAINAVAISDDGKHLAVGGVHVFRNQAGFRIAGYIAPATAMSEEMSLDRGAIHVFDTQSRAVRSLRGHKDAVQALAFAPSAPGKPPVLVSAALERGAEGKDVGSVRIWDVAAGKEILDRQVAKTIEALQVPTLAVRRAPTTAAVEVAVAGIDRGVVFLGEGSEDFTFRYGTGVCNGAVAFVPDEDAVIVGINDLFGKWPLTELRREQPLAAAGHQFADGAIPVLAGYCGGAARRIVCVTLAPGAERKYQLSLLAADSLKPIAGPTLHWPDLGRRPLLALSAGSSRIAVAAGSSDVAEVFDVAEWANGRPEPQRLAGVGVAVAAVDWVRHGDRVGIQLKRAVAAGGADLILDLPNRRFAADAAAWTVDAAPADGWRMTAELEGQDETRVGKMRFVGPGNVEATVAIAGLDAAPSSWAVLPRAGARKPLAAIALSRLHEPVLGLFDLEAGTMLRQLIGHSRLAHSLRFSRDGRLLASVAGDQTVCVWGLRDLEQVVGKNGCPLGVEAVERGGRVVVTRVDPTAGQFAPGELQVGDVILELTDDGETVRLGGITKFFDAFDSARVGGKVVALRLRPGQPPARVGIAVGQGSDSRKPLFSLFLTATSAAAAADAAARAAPVDPAGPADAMVSWIAWSPMGPYDCSGPPAEARLGWHFNTANAAAPTAYVNVEQLRKDFYRPGLLARLVADGVWRSEIAAPPPPPALSLCVKDAGRRRLALGSADWPVLRSNAASIHLTVSSFPPEFLAGARASLDGGPARPLTALGNMEWQLDLADRPLARGVHSIAVVVGTAEAPPREFAVDGAFEFYPPAPQLELPTVAAAQNVVAEERFELPIRVARTDPAVPAIQVQVEHRVAGKLVRQATRDLAAQQADWTPTFSLEPGANTIHIRAVNAGADPDRAELEATARTATIVYNKKPDAPPRIVAWTIRPAPVDAASRRVPTVPSPDAPVDAASRRVPEDSKLPHANELRFADPAVRVAGRIEAAAPIALASLVVDGIPMPLPIVNLANAPDQADPSARVHAATFDIPLALKPGPQTLVVRARTASSEWTERAQAVAFRPPTPRLHMVEPADQAAFTQGRAPKSLRVVGRIEPGDFGDFEARLLINGQPAPTAPNAPVDAASRRVPPAVVKIDRAAKTVTTEIAFSHELRSLQWQTTNRWGSEAKGDPVAVRFLRPPRVVAAIVPARVAKASVAGSLRLESALPVLGVSIASSRGPTIERTLPQGSAGPSVLELGDLPLLEGENRLTFSARNADGWSVEPAAALVVFDRPAEKTAAPVVEFVDPQSDRLASAARLALLVRVQSKAPLRALQLTHKSSFGQRVVFAGEGAARLQAGEHRFNVDLARGPNDFEWTAANDGGQARARLTVTKTAAPPRFVVDRLLSNDGGGPEIAFRSENNRVRFESPAPTAKVRLHGRLLWTDPDAALDAPLAIGARVNGLQQLAVLAEPREEKALERRFVVRLVLNRGRDNRVRLAPTGFAVDAASQSEWRMDCSRPAVDRNVFVVGIAPFSSDETGLRTRLARAIHSTESNPDRCAFGKLQPPLLFVGSKALRGCLNNALAEIKEHLVERGDSNAVVLIYYEGTERPAAASSTANAPPPVDAASRRVPNAPSSDSTVDAASRRVPPVPDSPTPGFRLLTWEYQHNPSQLDRSSISDRQLAERFASTPGAHVLLLEVQRKPTDAPAAANALDREWPRRSDVAMFRLAYGQTEPLEDKMRLLPNVADALPKATKLGELDGRILSQLESASPAAQRRIQYDPYIPVELSDLDLSRQP